MATVPPYDDALAGARLVVARYTSDAGHLPRSLELENAARMLGRAALRARVSLSAAVSDGGRIVVDTGAARGLP